MPDINALWQQAQGMSVEQLAQAIAGRFPTMPAAIAAPALMAKKQLTEAGRLQQGAKPPQGTVLGDLEKELTGVGSLPPGTLAPPQQLQPQQLMPQIPPPQRVQDGFLQPPIPDVGGMRNQGINGGRGGYAGGGIVALEDGELVPDAYSGYGGQFWPTPVEVTPFDPRRGYFQQNVPAVEELPGFLGGMPGVQAMPQPARAVNYGGLGGFGYREPFAGAASAVPVRGGQGIRAGGVGDTQQMMESAMANAAGFTNRLMPGYADQLADVRVQAERSPADYLKERKDLLASQGVTGLAGEAQQAELDKMKADLASRQGNRFGQALLQAGLATMAGTSPYALQNIGAGASVGLKQFLESEKLDAEDKAKLLTITTSIDNQRRAEAIGNVDAADKQKQQAINSYQSMTQHGQMMTANFVHSLMSSQIGLESHKMQAAASAGARADATAARELAARLAADERRFQTEQVALTRQSGMLNQLYTEAQKELDKRSNMMTGGSDALKFQQMTDDQKKAWIDSYVTQGMEYQKTLHSKGIGGFNIPAAAPTRTYNPITGKLE